MTHSFPSSLALILFWLSASLSFAGCAVCSEEARASVVVTVVDDAGIPLLDAEVRYESEGEVEPCERIDQAYVCGYERDGALQIRVERSGYQDAEQSVRVSAGRCHVRTERITIRLDPSS